MQTIDPDIRKYDKYFITPDYNHDIAYEYYLKIESALKSGIQLLQFRSKNLSVVEYSEIAGKIYGLCKTYRVKFIINDYKNLELNLYCDGVQLTSENLRNIKIKNINKKFIIIGSCHNIKKKGIGWEKFKKLASFSKYPVFGLGGLDYNVDINNVKKNGGIGIAASSYFYNLFNS